MDYKIQKEAFVSGLQGTSLREVCAVAATSVASYYLRDSLGLWWLNSFSSSSSSPSRLLRVLSPSHFCFDFALLVLPCLFSLLHPHLSYFLLLGQITLSALLSLPQRISPRHGEAKWQKDVAEDLNGERPTCVSQCRTALLILTSLSILAVDFHAFPRRLAKTETFGVSLMDAGVGGFVFSAGFCSRLARYSRQQHTKEAQPRSSLSSLLQGCESALPMLALGGARIVVNARLNYQTHVSEYGTHWSFFFTLGVVAVLAGLFRPFLCLPGRATGLATGLMLGYQVILSAFGGTDYLLHAPRTDLISANKEGLWTSVGYFCIYLLGIDLGAFFFQSRPHVAGWWRFLRELLLLDGALWIATLLCEAYVQRVSRRMVNLGYICFTLALNLLLLAGFLCCALALPARPPTSILTQALAKNSLPFFLLANLSTGFVNISMRTLYMSYWTSVLVLLAYSVWIFAVPVLWLRRGWSFSFWKSRQ